MSAADTVAVGRALDIDELLALGGSYAALWHSWQSDAVAP